MINNKGELNSPELFALLSNLRIQFGWYPLNYNFNIFDSLVIISNFNIKYSGNNVLDLTLSFGSPLTQFNKIDPNLNSYLKDTSNLLSIQGKATPEFNGKQDILSDQVIERQLQTINKENAYT